MRKLKSRNQLIYDLVLQGPITRELNKTDLVKIVYEMQNDKNF